MKRMYYNVQNAWIKTKFLFFFNKRMFYYFQLKWNGNNGMNLLFVFLMLKIFSVFFLWRNKIPLQNSYEVTLFEMHCTSNESNRPKTTFFSDHVLHHFTRKKVTNQTQLKWKDISLVCNCIPLQGKKGTQLNLQKV